MHIGFDAKRAFNNTSGLGNYSRFVINSLLRLYPQHHYTLFTPRTGDLFKDFYKAGEASAEVATPRGFGKKLPAAWRTFGMAQEFSRRSIHVYHGLSNELPYGLRNSRTRQVVTIHDLIFLRYPNLYRLPDRVIYKKKFSDACRSAHHIVAISEQTKADIINYFGTSPDKISVIYQDCDPVFHQQLQQQLEEIRHTYNLPQQYVLCVGTLEPRKNQLTLLQAWHRSGCHHEYDLVLVGRQTPYANELKQYIEQHQLQQKVHFPPYIPFGHLPGIYRMASLFVYPSVFEGFGIPIIEALNCEVPVITSTGSCFSEAGGPGALYTTPGNIEELAAAMHKVLTDGHLQQHLRQQGHQHVQQFRAEVTMPQLMEVYGKG